MARNQRKYNTEYKVQAVKLSNEIGSSKAAVELGIPVDTLYGWVKAVKEGRLDIGGGAHTPQTAMSLAEELNTLRKQVKLILTISVSGQAGTSRLQNFVLKKGLLHREQTLCSSPL